MLRWDFQWNLFFMRVCTFICTYKGRVKIWLCSVKKEEPVCVDPYSLLSGKKKVTLTAAAKTKSNQCHRGLWRSNIRLLHVNGTVLWTLQSSTWPFTCYIFQKMDQRSSWHLPHEKQIMTKLCREKVAENTCDVSWYRWSSVTTLGGKQLSTFNQTHLRVKASANIWNNHLLLFCWLFYRIETIKTLCPIDFTFQRRIGRWISHLQKDFWLLCVRTRSLECSSGAAAGPSHLLLAPFITLPAMASVFTTT